MQPGSPRCLPTQRIGPRARKIGGRSADPLDRLRCHFDVRVALAELVHKLACREREPGESVTVVVEVVVWVWVGVEGGGGEMLFVLLWCLLAQASVALVVGGTRSAWSISL